MTQELSPRERALVAAFGIHDAEMTAAATARARGWKPGTRLHGGPICDRRGREVEKPVDIVITAVGVELVLAIPVSGDGAERSLRSPRTGARMQRARVTRNRRRARSELFRMRERAAPSATNTWTYATGWHITHA